jgi:hypothetical protein
MSKFLRIKKAELVSDLNMLNYELHHHFDDLLEIARITPIPANDNTLTLEGALQPLLHTLKDLRNFEERLMTCEVIE